MKNLLSDFTNQYSLSKTLRFELIPIGKTKQFIEEKELLNQDEERAEDYKLLKKIIDEYHKGFIEEALKNFQLSNLSDYLTFYMKKEKDETEKKGFKTLKDKLRKQIAESLRKHDKFKNINKKELIQEDLFKWLESNLSKVEEYGNYELVKETIEKFKHFTTYFTGFHENRQNMYTDKDHSTAIAYRLVHDNLPKFIDNLNIFKLINDKHTEFEISTIEKELEEILQRKLLKEVFTLEFFNSTLTQNGIDFYNDLLGGRTEKDSKTKIKGINEFINLYNQKQTDKKQRIPKFTQLYKQILSDRSSISFIPEEFKDDNEVLESIENFYQTELCNSLSEGANINVFNSFQNLLEHLSDFDLTKLYIRNDTSLTNISQKIFGDWSIIGKALREYYPILKPVTEKEKQTKKYTRILKNG